MTRWSIIFFLSLFSSPIFAEVASEMHIEGYPGSTTSGTQKAIASALTVKNQQNLDFKSKQAWQTFFEKLSACSEGSVSLTQINPILAKQYGDVVTNKIIAIENNRCHLVMMYYAENDPRLTQMVSNAMSYPAGQECYLKKETVDAVIALETEILAGNEVTVSNQDALSKAMASECSTFVVVNGKKIMDELPQTVMTV